MSKHTPGEWIYAYRNRAAFDVYAGAFSGDTERRRARVAEVVSNGQKPIEEMRANACLIAAAPDLLAALELYLERERELHGDIPIGMRCVTDAARAAIAKATGGTP